jgi:hypothetical protein
MAVLRGRIDRGIDLSLCALRVVPPVVCIAYGSNKDTGFWEDIVP